MLDWLNRPAKTDTALEVESLCTQLTELSALSININQFYRILELFQARADNAWDLLAGQLHDSNFAISRTMRFLFHAADEMQMRICEGYVRVLNDVEHRPVRDRRRDPAAVAGRALKTLHKRLVIAAFLLQPTPPELWQNAHRFFAVARSENLPDEKSPRLERHAGRTYREILAFAVVQPERLSGAEVAATVDYLERFAPAIVVRDRAPEQVDYRLFWIDPASDMAPTAVARRLPETHPDVLYFSCQRLGTLAAEHLRALEEGTVPQELLLPASAVQPTFRALLKKLHESWSEPPTRHLQRRRQNFRVQMVVGLAAIASELASDGEGLDDTTLLTWTVCNESPSGYALVRESSETGGVVAGELVAIRADSEKPWDICVVRRVLSERDDTVELGLQVVASRARPVRLAFRHAAHAAKALHYALLLPAVPTLRNQDAVLVAAGVAVSQRFVIVAGENNTHISQGRIVSRELHTPCIELLQFQDDPYPL